MTNREYMQKNEINSDFYSWGYPAVLFKHYYDKYFIWLDEECTEASISAMNFHKEHGPKSEATINREAKEELDKLLEEYLNESKF